MISKKEKRIQEALGLRKTPRQLQGIIDTLRKKYEEDTYRLHCAEDLRDREDKRLWRERIVIMRNLREVSVKDYLEWLEGYLHNGGCITHYYNYPLANGKFYVAQCPLELPTLTGSLAFNLIVPAGINVQPLDNVRGFGHTEVFWMDGFKKANNSWVPVYDDTNFREGN